MPTKLAKYQRALQDDVYAQMVAVTGMRAAYPDQLVQELARLAGAPGGREQWLAESLVRWAASNRMMLDDINQQPTARGAEDAFGRLLVACTEVEKAAHLSADLQEWMLGVPPLFSVRMKLPPRPPPTMADKQAVSELLLNLREIAAKARALAAPAREAAATAKSSGPIQKHNRVMVRRVAISQLAPMFHSLTDRRPAMTTKRVGRGPWADFATAALRPVFGKDADSALGDIKGVAGRYGKNPGRFRVGYFPPILVAGSSDEG